MASAIIPLKARWRSKLRLRVAGVLVVLGLGCAPSISQAQAPTIASPQAILLDYDSGTVLFERAADVASAPASLAKLMTMAVVFRELSEERISLDTQFKVSE